MGIVENGIYKEVHPTFLYESIVCLLIFILLYFIKNKREFKGQLTYIYLVLYGVARAIIEGLRTDSLMFGNFRISQIVSIIIGIVGCIILIYNRIYKKIKKGLF